MIIDIDENIIKKDFSQYIYETGILSENNNKKKIFNYESEEIGEIYAINKNDNDTNKKKENKGKKETKEIKVKKKSKNLNNFKGSFYFNALMKCLVNIKYLKDCLLNKEFIYSKKIKNKKIINDFSKIVQYMWNYKIECEPSIFLCEIQSLSKIDDIYKNLDLLIEFLLYSMYKEEIENRDIDYQLNSLKKGDVEINESFIHNLFFFELEYICVECNHVKNKTNNFILYYNLKDFANQKSLNIESFIKLKKDDKCYKCNKTKKFHYIFKNCPKILLIFFKEIEWYHKFSINNKGIDLKNNISKDNKEKSTKYHLIGLIKDFGVLSDEEKKVVSYSVSPVDNLWYEYINIGIDNNKSKNNESIKFDAIKNDSKMPNLLIYERDE